MRNETQNEKFVYEFQILHVNIFGKPKQKRNKRKVKLTQNPSWLLVIV